MLEHKLQIVNPLDHVLQLETALVHKTKLGDTETHPLLESIRLIYPTHHELPAISNRLKRLPAQHLHPASYSIEGQQHRYAIVHAYGLMEDDEREIAWIQSQTQRASGITYLLSPFVSGWELACNSDPAPHFCRQRIARLLN